MRNTLCTIFFLTPLTFFFISLRIELATVSLNLGSRNRPLTETIRYWVMEEYLTDFIVFFRVVWCLCLICSYEQRRQTSVIVDIHKVKFKQRNVLINLFDDKVLKFINFTSYRITARTSTKNVRHLQMKTKKYFQTISPVIWRRGGSGKIPCDKRGRNRVVIVR